jgi:hypothetical protein
VVLWRQGGAALLLEKPSDPLTLKGVDGWQMKGVMPKALTRCSTVPPSEYIFHDNACGCLAENPDVKPSLSISSGPSAPVLHPPNRQQSVFQQ